MSYRHLYLVLQPLTNINNGKQFSLSLCYDLDHWPEGYMILNDALNFA